MEEMGEGGGLSMGRSIERDLRESLVMSSVIGFC